MLLEFIRKKQQHKVECIIIDKYLLNGNAIIHLLQLREVFWLHTEHSVPLLVDF